MTRAAYFPAMGGLFVVNLSDDVPFLFLPPLEFLVVWDLFTDWKATCAGGDGYEGGGTAAVAVGLIGIE